MAESDVTTSKRCSKCKLIKVVGEFGKDRQKSDGFSSACKACRRLQSVAYYAANRESESQRLKDWVVSNPDRAKARRKRHYEENRESVLAQCRAWREANVGRIRETVKAYATANREKIRIRKLLFRRANPDVVAKRRKAYVEARRHAIRERLQKYWMANKNRLAERRKLYRQQNKLIVAAGSHRRRARERGAPGKHTGAQLKTLYVMQKGKCAACRISLRVGHHVDHIFPLARGGSNDISNIQLLCPTCNLSKNAKDPFDFAKQRGMLL